jgi:hypothetical protein
MSLSPANGSARASHYARGPSQKLEVLSWGFDLKTTLNWPLEWTVRCGGGP